eukprot:scaffold347_cov239-Pinguiococcus_pyrenoidosus.AAC.4
MADAVGESYVPAFFADGASLQIHSLEGVALEKARRQSRGALGANGAPLQGEALQFAGILFQDVRHDDGAAEGQVASGQIQRLQQREQLLRVQQQQVIQRQKQPIAAGARLQGQQEASGLQTKPHKDVRRWVNLRKRRKTTQQKPNVSQSATFLRSTVIL